jgi:hypothetical protein
MLWQSQIDTPIDFSTVEICIGKKSGARRFARACDFGWLSGDAGLLAVGAGLIPLARLVSDVCANYNLIIEPLFSLANKGAHLPRYHFVVTWRDRVSLMMLILAGAFVGGMIARSIIFTSQQPAQTASTDGRPLAFLLNGSRGERR